LIISIDEASPIESIFPPLRPISRLGSQENIARNWTGDKELICEQENGAEK